MRKLKLVSKSMLSQTGLQIIVTHMLPNISGGKSNQTMKFTQLIEYNIRNKFLGTSFTKFGGKANPRPFYKEAYL